MGRMGAHLCVSGTVCGIADDRAAIEGVRNFTGLPDPFCEPTAAEVVKEMCKIRRNIPYVPLHERSCCQTL
jgi:hypothetical protein